MSPSTKERLKLVIAGYDKALRQEFIRDITSVSLVCVYRTSPDYRLERPVYVQLGIEGTHPASGASASVTLLHYTYPISNTANVRIPAVEELAKALSAKLQVPLDSSVRFNPSNIRSAYAHAFAR